MLQSTEHVSIFVLKFEHPEIHNNMIMESYNGGFFKHIYPYKIRLELSSEEFKQTWEETKVNVLNKETLSLEQESGSCNFVVTQ